MIPKLPTPTDVYVLVLSYSCTSLYLDTNQFPSLSFISKDEAHRPLLSECTFLPSLNMPCFPEDSEIKTIYAHICLA